MVMNFEELKQKYRELVHKALLKLKELNERLIGERESILKENEDIKQEMSIIEKAGKLNYDALKRDRQVYYRIKDVLERTEGIDEEKLKRKKKIEKDEKKIAIEARKINIGENKLLHEIKEVEELENEQLDLDEKEVDSINHDIAELRRINDLIQRAARNPNSKALEEAASIIEEIEADVSTREEQTKERIKIANRKKKLMKGIRNLEKTLIRKGIKIIKRTRKVEV